LKEGIEKRGRNSCELLLSEVKLGVFCYILTVQNVVYVLCINFYTLSNLKEGIEKRGRNQLSLILCHIHPVHHLSLILCHIHPVHQPSLILRHIHPVPTVQHSCSRNHFNIILILHVYLSRCLIL
jgi:hypothetical protein